MTNIEALGQVEILLQKGWTTGTNARGRSRLPVDATHPRAVCWCINGALLKVFGLPSDDTAMFSPERKVYLALKEELEKDIPKGQGVGVTSYNDCYAYRVDNVIALIRRTQARLLVEEHANV